MKQNPYKNFNFENTSKQATRYKRIWSGLVSSFMIIPMMMETIEKNQTKCLHDFSESNPLSLLHFKIEIVGNARGRKDTLHITSYSYCTKGI